MMKMLVAIVSSSQDPAGTLIRKTLLSMLGTDGSADLEYGKYTLRFLETKDRLIYENGLDARTGADLIVFISRHASKNPFPALTVHVTGNYGEAGLGGDPRSLAAAAPEWMHAVLNRLNERSPGGYRISYEVTHHGPTDMNTPSFFVEIGSTEKEWDDENAAETVASSLLEVLKGGPGPVIRVIGFGGNHYAARETETALTSRAAFGHMVHTRDVPLIDEAMIGVMAEKTRADAAYIDKKAVKTGDVRRIEKILAEKKIPVLSEGEFRSINDLGWETYLEIRALAERTIPGCRIEVKDLSGEGELVTAAVDGELVNEAIKADKKTFSKLIGSMPVVCLVSAKGIFQPIFITYKENRVQLINDLITLCVKILHRERGTTVEGDLLTIKKTRIDPRKAAELGVPKGPLLGILASGRDVELNGRVINPSMVLKIEEKTIRVPGLEGYL